MSGPRHACPQPGENAPAFSPDQEKAAPPQEPLFLPRGIYCLTPAAGGPSRGGLRAPDPRRIGVSWDVPSGWILPWAPFLIRPLSGGSARRFTVPGEAAPWSGAHAQTAEGAEVAAAQLPRA